MVKGVCFQINVSNTTLYIVLGVMACASLATGRPTVLHSSTGHPSDYPTVPGQTGCPTGRPTGPTSYTGPTGRHPTDCTTAPFLLPLLNQIICPPLLS